MEVTYSALTDEDLLTLPSGRGETYELIEGELKVMTAAGNRHGEVINNISGYIFMYLDDHPIGTGVAAETGFYTRGDKETVRAPDYAFIPNTKIPPEGLPDGYSPIVPDLVVEVVSKYDRAVEINEKVLEWLDFGVSLVWVLYHRTEQIYIYRRNQHSPEVLTAQDTLLGENVLPDFRVPVAKVFKRSGSLMIFDE